MTYMGVSKTLPPPTPPPSLKADSAATHRRTNCAQDRVARLPCHHQTFAGDVRALAAPLNARRYASARLRSSLPKGLAYMLVTSSNKNEILILSYTACRYMVSNVEGGGG